MAWVMLVLYAMLGLVVKPILIVKIVKYRWSDIRYVFFYCLKVTLLAVPLPCLLYRTQGSLSLGRWTAFVLLILISVICVAIGIWFAGIDENMRKKIIDFAKKHVAHHKNHPWE